MMITEIKGGNRRSHNVSIYLSALRLLLLIACTQAIDLFPSYHKNQFLDSKLRLPIAIYNEHKWKIPDDLSELELEQLYGTVDLKRVADQTHQRQHVQSRYLQGSNSSCATTDRDLRFAVRNSNARNSTQPTLITICTEIIIILWLGINISNRHLIIECSVVDPKSSCTLDAKGVSRIFRGSNTTITFRNIYFTNGFHKYSGGAVELVDSIAVFVNCTFENNRIDGNFSSDYTTPQKYTGGAVMINNSNASFINCQFANNYIVGFQSFTDFVITYGAALFVNNSIVKIYQCLFFNNSAGISYLGGGGAIFLEGSDVVIDGTDMTQFISNEGMNVRNLCTIKHHFALERSCNN
jgi:hypothetical protein